MKIAIPRHSLKSSILIQITFVICLCFITIVGYNSHANREVVIQSVKEFIKKQNETVISRVVNYVTSSKDVADCGVSFLLKLNEHEQEQVVCDYVLRTIKTVSGVWSVSVTTKNNVFIRGTEIEPDLYKKLNPGKGIPEFAKFILGVQYDQNNVKYSNSSFFSTQLKLLGPACSMMNNKDKRPAFKWHENSLRNKKTQWSDIYIEPENNLPSITYSVPAVSAADELVGGFSIDVNLNDLAFFLNEMRISDKTRLFIINQKNQIIADSDMGEDHKILSVDETKNQILSTALNIKGSNKKEAKYFKINGEEFVTLTMPFPSSFDLKWKIAAVVPLKDFTEAFEDIQRNNLLISAIAIIFILVFLFFLAEKFSRPISDLGVEVEKIKQLELDDPVTIKSNINEIEHLSHVVQNLKVSVSNFSKYIPKKLVQNFIDNGKEVKIGGETSELTILFSDIKDFTTISESTPAQNLAEYVSEYFEEMSDVLHLNHATIDKFIGDAIMAFWGAPDPDDDKDVHACRAALMCQQKLLRLNKYWKLQGFPPLITRIGIHTGTTMVGNVGSSERMNYTSLGDTVNTAARLEAINKKYGTHIIISETVASKIGPEFTVRPVDLVVVKGKKQGVRIFELIGVDGDPYISSVSEQHKTFARMFTEAFEIFLSRKWKIAKKAFEDLERLNSEQLHIEDSIISMYIERCANFIKNPPPEDWDGSIVMTMK